MTETVRNKMTITIEFRDNFVNKTKGSIKQICPYYLTGLVHLYKLEFPNRCYNYDDYVTSPFFQTYILGEDNS